MSKPIQRPSGEKIQQNRAARRQAQRELRKRQHAQGLVSAPRVVIPNTKSPYKTVEEEREARLTSTTEQVRIFRAQLPTLLESLGEIKDLRNPKKITHKLTVLLLYGILTFVFQMTSRRHANRTMTHPLFVGNLKLLFPDLESIPHHDTLNRVLCDIDVSKIEDGQIEIVRKFIRNKTD